MPLPNRSQYLYDANAPRNRANAVRPQPAGVNEGLQRLLTNPYGSSPAPGIVTRGGVTSVVGRPTDLPAGRAPAKRRSVVGRPSPRAALLTGWFGKEAAASYLDPNSAASFIGGSKYTGPGTTETGYSRMSNHKLGKEFVEAQERAAAKNVAANLAASNMAVVGGAAADGRPMVNAAAQAPAAPTPTPASSGGSGTTAANKFQAFKDRVRSRREFARQRQFARAQFRGNHGHSGGPIMFDDENNVDILGTYAARGNFNAAALGGSLDLRRDQMSQQDAYRNALLAQQGEQFDASHDLAQSQALNDAGFRNRQIGAENQHRADTLALKGRELALAEQVAGSREQMDEAQREVLLAGIDPKLQGELTQARTSPQSAQEIEDEKQAQFVNRLNERTALAEMKQSDPDRYASTMGAVLAEMEQAETPAEKAAILSQARISEQDFRDYVADQQPMRILGWEPFAYNSPLRNPRAVAPAIGPAASIGAAPLLVAGAAANYLGGETEDEFKARKRFEQQMRLLLGN